MNRYREKMIPMVTPIPGIVIWLPAENRDREIPEEVWEAILEASWSHPQSKNEDKKQAISTGTNVLNKIVSAVAKRIH